MADLFSSSRVRILAVLAFIILSAGVNLRYCHDKIIPTDDNFLMYMTSHVFTENAAINTNMDRFIGFIQNNDYDPETINHFVFRYKNMDNYLLHAAGIKTARLLLGEPNPDTYARTVYETIRLGSHLAHWVVLALVAFVLLRLKDGRYALAVLLASVAMIGITALDLVPRPHWRIGAYADPWQYLQAVGKFFFDTGGGWSPFGPAGRSAMTMLLFALFPLRWAGRFGWSYAILLAMCFTHQTYAGIMVLALVSMDAVVRPHILRHPGVAAAAAATLALFLLRESLWQVFAGWWLPLGLLGVVGLIAGLSFAARRYPALGRALGVTGLERAQTLTADLILLSAGLVSLLAVSWVMSRLDDSPTALFVWQEMTARPLALIKIPLVTGLCVLLISWLAARFPRFVRMGYGALAGLVIVACAAGGMQYARVAQTAGTLNPTGTNFANHAQGYYQEVMADPTLTIPDEVAFYALNREIDLKDGTLTRLLTSRVPRQ